MDNAIVGVTGAGCFILAQFSTNIFESITPLGIIAIVVYYFLVKFDKKLDKLENITQDIKDAVDSKADKNTKPEKESEDK